MKEQRHIFVAIFPELTQTNTQQKYIAADCSLHGDRVNVMLSVLPHSTFTVQILYKLYSLQLNCTYNNYTQAAGTRSAAHKLPSWCLLKWSAAGYLEL
jgi:hypothetical protein